MSNTREEFELIEKYLKGELSSSQQKAVENQIAHDQEFADDVQAHLIADELVVDHTLLQTRIQMSDWHKENESGPEWGKTLVGLSLAVLVVAGYLFFDFSKTEETSMVEQSPTKVESKSNYSVIKQIPKKASEVTVPQKKTSRNQTFALVDTIEKRPQEEFPVLRRKQPKMIESYVNIPKVEIKQITDEACVHSFSVEHLQFNGSCEGEVGGSIVFSGAWLEELQPVAFSIDSGETYVEAGDFQLLKNGAYHPSLIDRAGCVFYASKQVELTSEGCENHTTFVINTTLNEYWEPNLEIRNARVFIRNSQGVLVYSTNLKSDFRWNGRSNSGVGLPMGNYGFIIESSGNVVKSGSITLLK